jgi:NAD(P)H-hydrate epimerase
MRSIDERAILELGIPGIALMEKAGSGTVERIDRSFGPIRGKRMVILCGGGNNGGDGFVAARYAANRGARVEVLLLAKPESVKGDARTALDVLDRLGRGPRAIEGEDAGGRIRDALADADLIVDALLGSGLTGEVRGVYRDAIDAINDARGRVTAVDNPSGIDMDSGAVQGTAVRADLTVTFGLPKRGHYLYPGRAYCGSLAVVDIGFPAEAIAAESIALEGVDFDTARALLPDRPGDAHKGDFGRVLVLAGSVGYSGAAALSALAALRAGAGLVTLGIPAGLNGLMEGKVTEVITRPLPETRSGALSRKALDPALELAAGMDAVVAGPGLSMDPETGEFVREFFQRCEAPLVLDADGVNAFVGRDDLLAKRTGETVMTPHPGELGRLTGMSAGEVNGRRIDLCVELAGRWGLVLVLKGAPTVTSDPAGACFLNLSGNSGLASGGTGDVLTGAIGGLLGQGASPLHAAVCGVYFHGHAGDRAAREVGGRGMIAGDVLDRLPAALGP